MPDMLTIQLARPIATVHVVGASDGLRPVESGPPYGHPQQGRAPGAGTAQVRQSGSWQQQAEELAQLCRMANRLVDQLNRLYAEMLRQGPNEVARLAVEIAQKILVHKIGQGDYDIRAIVEEALKHAPTRQSITVRVNPEDLPGCQQLQQEYLQGAAADLAFVADGSIARADCLLETPKGIVKSFVEEHLERIGETLMKVD